MKLEERINRAGRNIAKGTRIKLHFGDKIIQGTLNDSTAARELIRRLPCYIHVSRYEFDICGIMAEPLPWQKDELVTGWRNGDISFTNDGDYFTVLFGHEEESEKYGSYANLGIVDGALSELDALHGSFDILIELDE